MFVSLCECNVQCIVFILMYSSILDITGNTDLKYRLPKYRFAAWVIMATTIEIAALKNAVEILSQPGALLDFRFFLSSIIEFNSYSSVCKRTKELPWVGKLLKVSFQLIGRHLYLLSELFDNNNKELI